LANPASGATTIIPFVEGAAGCTGAGWYYDDPAAPTTITLCGASCSTVSADTEGRVDVTLGCQTILN